MARGEAIHTERFNILLSADIKNKLTAAARARGISRAEYIRSALEASFKVEREQAVIKAVKEVAPLYETDQELTAFTDLDGEDYS